MRSLQSRITTLEHRRRIATEANPACAVCGRINGKCPEGVEARFTVSMQGWDPEPDLPEFCPGCGARQVFTLEFDDRD